VICSAQLTFDTLPVPADKAFLQRDSRRCLLNSHLGQVSVSGIFTVAMSEIYEHLFEGNIPALAILS